MATMARTMRSRGASFTSADVPDQLQRAARELQAAIQSVRRRRGSTEQPTPRYHAIEDKENASFLQNLDASGEHDRPGKDTCEELITKLTTEELGVCEDEGESDEEDELALSQLSGLSGISAVSSDDSDAWLISREHKPTDQKTDQPPKQDDAVGDTLHDEARRALSRMQREVERQAQDNKTMTERLAIAVHGISEAIADAVPAARSRLPRTEEVLTVEGVISPEHIEIVVEQSRLALDEWRSERQVEKTEFADRFAAFRDECEGRLQLLEAKHRHECDEMKEELRREQQKAGQRETLHLGEQQQAQVATRVMQIELERLQCECEDNAAQLLRQSDQLTAKPSPFTPTEASSDRAGHGSTRELLDLAALAKEADLRALQWRMMFEEQSEAAMQTEARLQMLLEDQLVSDERVKQTLQRMVPRQSIEAYQERIGWMEEHVRDMQSQIECDREQFDYEVAKWEQEKLSARAELAEIRDVSIKLLKTLVIREKLLKKREHKQINRLKDVEHKLETHRETLKQDVQTLMEESAALLLVLQQLAVQAVPVPITPAHMRTTIKQLKRLSRALDKLEIVAFSEVAADNTTLSFSVDSNANDTIFDATEAKDTSSEFSRWSEAGTIENA